MKMEEYVEVSECSPVNWTERKMILTYCVRVDNFFIIFFSCISSLLNILLSSSLVEAPGDFDEDPGDFDDHDGPGDFDELGGQGDFDVDPGVFDGGPGVFDDGPGVFDVLTAPGDFDGELGDFDDHDGPGDFDEDPSDFVDAPGDFDDHDGPGESMRIRVTLFMRSKENFHFSLC